MLLRCQHQRCIRTTTKKTYSSCVVCNSRYRSVGTSAVKQKAQLSQRGRATVRVVENRVKSLKITQSSQVESNQSNPSHSHLLWRRTTRALGRQNTVNRESK